jgi:hypothetical protein
MGPGQPNEEGVGAGAGRTLPTVMPAESFISVIASFLESNANTYLGRGVSNNIAPTASPTFESSVS